MDVRFTGIYAIVDLAITPRPLALVDAILAGGVRLIQYRAKAGVARDVVRAIHARTRVAGATLVVNDDFGAALDADGWHAGQEDLAGRDVAALRATLGSRLFGVSCDDGPLARAAQAFGADYVGVGPFAVTTTKSDAGSAIGRPGIASVVRATSLPVVAIGGIDAGNLADVAATGAAMAAVVSAIARASDPEAATRTLVRQWESLRTS